MISAMFGRAGARIAVAAALSLYLGTAHAEEQKVTIDNFTFSPATLKVKVGDTVTWTNHDDIPHTVMSAEDAAHMRSPVLDTDDTFSLTFDKPGTYRFFCSLHPHMQSRVVVQ